MFEVTFGNATTTTTTATTAAENCILEVAPPPQWDRRSCDCNQQILENYFSSSSSPLLITIPLESTIFLVWGKRDRVTCVAGCRIICASLKRVRRGRESSCMYLSASYKSLMNSNLITRPITRWISLVLRRRRSRAFCFFHCRLGIRVLFRWI